MVLVSPAIPVISYGVNTIGDLFIQEILNQWGVRDKINLLRDELQAIECFLKDISCNQNLDERARNWMIEARDIGYEAEDVLDWVVLKLNKYIALRKAVERHKIGTKIDLINDKVRKIAERRNTYGISSFGTQGQGEQESSSSSSSNYFQIWRRSHPQPEDDHTTSVVEMKIDEEEISQRLLDDKVQYRSVIPILGMGGIGKTTLATIVYRKARSFVARNGAASDNTDDNGIHFNICAWLSVTQYYRIEQLIRKLIKEVAGTEISEERSEKMEYRELVNKLRDILRGRRYLIVMDDVWAPEVWDLVSVALPDSNNGSRVILTTRSIEVARHANPHSDPHQVQPLDEAKSFELFERRVFGRSRCPRELEDLGLQLSKKCCGLPLALVVLGGLLSAKPKNPVTWLNLAKNMSWEMGMRGGKQCLEILALSYNDLPYHIKSCFFFLGAFPEGYDIPASKLKEMWIAEGLIACHGNETVEEVAEYYLEEMIQRCLVQVVKRWSNESAKLIRIHDFLHKLSVIKASEDRFLQVESIPCSGTVPQRESKAAQGIRRLSIHEDSTPHFHLQAGTLRVLLVFHKKGRPAGSSSREAVQPPTQRKRKTTPEAKYQFGSSMKCLRLLELEGMHGLDVLEDKLKLEKMKLLKYLGLRDTNLCNLPASVGKLHNLQTLNLRGTQIKTLPEEIMKLKMLRHLYLNSEVCPPKIDCFTNLQVLQQAKYGDWVVGLPNLTDLRKLSIDGVHTWEKLREGLAKLSHLESLKLSGSFIPTSVIEAVSKNGQLHELNLNGKILNQMLPEGIELFPRYLTKLVLVSSRLRQDPMPVLEQLSSLRILKMKSVACVEESMVCSAGGFLSLQQLKIKEMSNFRHWTVQADAMPGLTRLCICLCYKLEMIPLGLQHITALQVLELIDMPPEFVRRVENPNGQDWHKIREVPIISIKG